jgi:hypothetical protein
MCFVLSLIYIYAKCKLVYEINRFNEFNNKYYKHEKIKTITSFLLEKYEDNIRSRLIEMDYLLIR